MRVVVIGLNHKSAPVEVRERLAVEPDQARQLLRQLVGLDGVNEAVVVSTCNRVEALVVAETNQAPEQVVNVLAARGGMNPGQLKGAVYVHEGPEAVRHIFRVGAGLDSLVMGEPQILGQMKDAYRLATAAGTTRSVLNRLMHKAFQVAKRVRTATGIGAAAVSVPYAAVKLAQRIFGELEGLVAMLVGAGEMAELAAEHLLGQGVSRLVVANRTFSRAEELARRFRGEAVALTELGDALGKVDIVITSTGSPEPIITPSLAAGAIRSRRGKPVLFIDIAVPRDVHPEVGGVDGCFLYDIDDLTQVVQDNIAARRAEALKAEAIVSEEVEKFCQWLEGLSVVPTIAALTAKAEEIRQAELAKTLKALGPEASRHAQALEAMTRALVKKLLHDPIAFIKTQGTKPEAIRSQHLAVVRRIFNLEENGADQGDT